MNETQARAEICRVGQSLFSRGYVHATAGNISVRVDEAEGDGLVMTPTDACLGFLDPARLSRIDARGRQTGGYTVSKILALHRTIYATARAFDPATACAIDTHSIHCVAASLDATGSELLPALTPCLIMKVGHVPLIPYQRPGSGAGANTYLRVGMVPALGTVSAHFYNGLVWLTNTLQVLLIMYIYARR